MKFKTRGVTRSLVIGVVLSFVGSLAYAEQPSNNDDENETRPQNIRAFFLLNNNDVPAFWRGPVVSSFFDASGNYTQVIEKSRVQAMFYAMASRVDAAYSENSDIPPNLAYVVADYQLDDLHLAMPLRKVLEEQWEGTPVVRALREPETRIQNNGVLDGTDCSVFVSGTQHNEAPSHYEIESALIIASSTLSETEIAVCFQNKTALVFGAASSNFDFDRNADPDVLKGIYFSLVPTFLELGSVCREHEFATTLSCVSRSMNERYGHLLTVLNQ